MEKIDTNSLVGDRLNRPTKYKAFELDIPKLKNLLKDAQMEDASMGRNSPTIISQGTGDFNGDWDLDIAMLINFNDDYSILTNNGIGDFVNNDFDYNSNINFAITSGDFDGDGDLDFVLGDNANGNIAFMKNSYLSTIYNIKAAIEGFLNVSAICVILPEHI